MPLTEDQFEALAQSMRLRTGRSASSKALRMVLVNEKSKEEAAAACMVQVCHIDAVLDSARQALSRAQLLQGVSIPETF